MTALQDVWAELDRTPDPGRVAAIVATRRHEGYGREEIAPCHCPTCGGVVAHHTPFSALETAARMTVMH